MYLRFCCNVAEMSRCKRKGRTTHPAFKVPPILGLRGEIQGEGVSATPIVAAWSPVYRSEILGEMLALSFDIICRAGLHCAPHYPAVQGGTVRFSLSRFTTEEEIEAVCDALWAIHSD